MGDNDGLRSPLRVQEATRVVERDGEMWFVAADVCWALGLDTSNLSKVLDEDELMTVHYTAIGMPPKSGNPDVSVVSESGLYSLVLRSRKPEAEQRALAETKVLALAEQMDSGLLIPSATGKGSCGLSLESGDEAVGKDGPISAYAPWAYIDLSQGGSDTRVSVNPNGGRNPHSPYAPLPTASEETPSSATRGCALIPGNAKLPPHHAPVKSTTPCRAP